MNSGLAIGIYVASGIVAALSQLLLKLSAQEEAKSVLAKFLNVKVIVAYIMLFSTIFMNMVAMNHIPYKFVSPLSTLSYIFVIILSNVVLKEKISKKQIVGMILIFIGIMVFNL